MKRKNIPQTAVSISIFTFFILLTTVQLSVADAIDQFDFPNLNKDLWEMMDVGKASYEIQDGILTMTSPDVESGIMLYYPQNLAGVDITIEVRLRPIIIADNVVTGFIAGLMEPQINTDINNNWLANFFFVAGNWYIKQDPVVIGEKPPNPPRMAM